MKARPAVTALDNAFARKKEVAGCILHSDRSADSVPGNSGGLIDECCIRLAYGRKQLGASNMPF